LNNILPPPSVAVQNTQCRKLYFWRLTVPALDERKLHRPDRVDSGQGAKTRGGDYVPMKRYVDV